jgi:hypothetical protein
LDVDTSGPKPSHGAFVETALVGAFNPSRQLFLSPEKNMKFEALMHKKRVESTNQHLLGSSTN